ncbi:hypothetical protein TrST_g6210 [Triparma strigata]|uniref:RING-type domain-containing protein n=1 Tax=Triparma strigata TaxID=1606541 RepID=A0A9W7BD21_9STRA|nr:hypothetical protein TrST_g6210 [Triparma strigata]
MASCTTTSSSSNPSRAAKRLKVCTDAPSGSGYVPILPDLAWAHIISYLNDVKELQILRGCDKFLSRLCQEASDRCPWMSADHCFDFRGARDGSDRFANVKDSRSDLVAKLHYAARDKDGMLCTKGSYATIDGWEWGGTTSFEVTVRSSFKQCYSTIFDFGNGDYSEQVTLSNDNKVLTGVDGDASTMNRVEWRVKNGQSSKFVRRVATCFNTEYDDPEVQFDESSNRHRYVPLPHRPTHGTPGQVAEEKEKAVGRPLFRRAATHIVMTVCGSTMKVYKDGVLSATKLNGQEPAVLKRDHHMIGACMYKNGPAYKLEGHVMQLRMWHGKELQAKDVKALYENQFLRSTYRDKIRGKLRINVEYPSGLEDGVGHPKHLFYRMPALKPLVNCQPPRAGIPFAPIQTYYVHPEDTVQSLKDLCAFSPSKLIVVTLFLGEVELLDGGRTLMSYRVEKDALIRLSFDVRVPCNRRKCSFMSKSLEELEAHNVSEHGVAPGSGGFSFWDETKTQPPAGGFSLAEAEARAIGYRNIDEEEEDDFVKMCQKVGKGRPLEPEWKSVNMAKFTRRHYMSNLHLDHLDKIHRSQKATCGTDGCSFTAPTMSSLCSHKSNFHNFTRFNSTPVCGIDGCKRSFPSDRHLSAHQALVHSVDWVRIFGPLKFREWSCDILKKISDKPCPICFEKYDLQAEHLAVCTNCCVGFCPLCARTIGLGFSPTGGVLSTICPTCSTSSITTLNAPPLRLTLHQKALEKQGKSFCWSCEWETKPPASRCDMCGEDLSLLGLSKRDRDKVTFGGAARGLVRDERGNIIRTCGIAGCQYKTGITTNMKKHKAAKHGIDGVWFYCDQDGCDYKVKVAGSIKEHKQLVHDIDNIDGVHDIDVQKGGEGGKKGKIL